MEMRKRLTAAAALQTEAAVQLERIAHERDLAVRVLPPLRSGPRALCLTQAGRRLGVAGAHRHPGGRRRGAVAGRGDRRVDRRTRCADPGACEERRVTQL
jgi:hypothetical protein